MIANIRLNNTHREKIAAEAVNQSVLKAELMKYEEELVELSTKIVAEELGDLSTHTETLKKMKELNSSLPKSCQFSISGDLTQVFSTAGYHARHGFSIDGGTHKIFAAPDVTSIELPRGNMYFNSGENELAKKYLKTLNVRNKTSEKLDNLRASVLTQLKQFTTTDQLLKSWPESEKLLEALNKATGTGLVVVPSNLNKAIWGDNE